MLKVITYVHEESDTPVSKVCKGCGEIRLREEYNERQGRAFYTSLCKQCEGESK